MRPRRLTGLVVAAAALLAGAGCGGSSTTTTHTAAATAPAASAPVSASSGSGHVVTARSGPLTATLTAGTHSPKVGRAWPIHLTATSGGAPAHASVSYEYLFGGAVVARRAHYTFTGHFSDVFEWPAESVGYPLTFRAVVAAGANTVDLDYPVQVGR